MSFVARFESSAGFSGRRGRHDTPHSSSRLPRALRTSTHAVAHPSSVGQRTSASAAAERRDDGKPTVTPSRGDPSSRGIYNSSLANSPPSVSGWISREVLAAGAKPFNAERYAAEKRSTLIAVGLSVHHAPVELRERLAVPESEVPRVIEELCRYPHIVEAAVLSTCNRMEVYVVARSFHPAVREVEAWMSACSGVALGELRGSLFLARDDAAVEHLMTVASGLDSLVIGEGQILAQVRQMHLVGQSVAGFGRVLTSLFKSAVTIGKRVRAETPIAEGAVSVSAAAAELAARRLREAGRPSLAGSAIVIVGAGKMARLLVKHLQGKGVSALTVVNRSIPRVDALAAEFPEIRFTALTISSLSSAIDKCDVAFFASGSSEILLHADDAAAHQPKPRTIVDISVPRNVDAAVGSVPGFLTFNVDDLKEVVEVNKISRSNAANAARALIADEVECFSTWKRNLDAVPKIRSLKDKAAGIVDSQMLKYCRKARARGSVSDSEIQEIEKLLSSTVNKLLHDPITALRTLPEESNSSKANLLDDIAHPWLTKL